MLRSGALLDIHKGSRHGRMSLAPLLLHPSLLTQLLNAALAAQLGSGGRD